jgi:hypothetical protein
MAPGRAQADTLEYGCGFTGNRSRALDDGVRRAAHAIQAFHRPPYRASCRNGDFGPLREVIGNVISIISGLRRALAAN